MYSSTIAIYAIAAVGPTLVLMWYIYKKDNIEKEPMNLLVKLALLGIPAALISMVLEGVGMAVVDRLLPSGSLLYMIVLCFLVIALVEEGSKYLMLRIASWRHPEFNCTFDGIVYSVFVSLGFAAFENIGYLMGYGLAIAPARAVLAVPAHMAFSIFMGLFYGRAKGYYIRGQQAKSKAARIMGILIAVLLHGFYDTCAMTASTTATILFYIFVVLMDIAMITVIKRESKYDRPL